MSAPTEKASDKKDGKPIAPNENTPGLSKLQQTAPVSKVIVHPLVLLSVVDHFSRINAKVQEEKRVMGALLGEVKKDKSVEIVNSFAVTLKELNTSDMACIVEVDYMREMHKMFKKVSKRDDVVGWYHTGPTLCKNDIAINEDIKKFVKDPVLVVIPISATEVGRPTDAYVEVQETFQDGRPPIKTFEHVESEVVAELAEEVGVEHLLRDIKGPTAGTLSQRITNQLMGLRGLLSQLADTQRYLRQVSRSEMPLNQDIVYAVQELLNLLPDVMMPDFVRAQNVQTNAQMMCVYVGTLVRAIISQHNVIDNKLILQKKKDEEKSSNSDMSTRSLSPARSMTSIKDDVPVSPKDLD